MDFVDKSSVQPMSMLSLADELVAKIRALGGARARARPQTQRARTEGAPGASAAEFDALIDRDPLEALSLLCVGVLLAPPFHRLLATRIALPTRLVITLVGVLVALGIGSAPQGHAAGLAPVLSPKAAAACTEAISEAARSGGERAREGIVRPWRKFWTDLRWARVAGRFVYEDWRVGRG